MSSWVGQFHDFTKKYDPLGHELVNGMWKSSTKIVNESSRAMVKGGEKLGINTDIPEYGRDLSAKDKGSFNRWGENTIGGVAASFGAGYAAGGSGASSGAGAGAGGGGAAGGAGGAGGGTVGVTGADGAFLGEGTQSGIGAWDSAGAGGTPWAKYMQQGGNVMSQMGGQKPETELEQSRVVYTKPGSLAESNAYAKSSEKLKSGPRASMRKVMHDGGKSGHPVDTNGMHIAAINELTQRIAAARSQVTKIKEARA